MEGHQALVRAFAFDVGMHNVQPTIAQQRQRDARPSSYHDPTEQRLEHSEVRAIEWGASQSQALVPYQEASNMEDYEPMHAMAASVTCRSRLVPGICLFFAMTTRVLLLGRREVAVTASTWRMYRANHIHGAICLHDRAPATHELGRHAHVGAQSTHRAKQTMLLGFLFPYSKRIGCHSSGGACGVHLV